MSPPPAPGLIDDPHATSTPIGGRKWSQWDRAQRAGLATAAFVLHVRNRALFDVGYDVLDRDVTEVIEAARDSAPPQPPPEPEIDLPDGTARDAPRAGRCGWG